MFSDLVIQLQAVSTLWKHSINSRKPSRPMGSFRWVRSYGFYLTVGTVGLITRRGSPVGVNLCILLYRQHTSSDVSTRVASVILTVTTIT